MGLVMNPFMENLKTLLINKRKVTESTATQYLQSLYKLNNSKVFSNFVWIKNYTGLEEILKKYALNTQRGYITSIVTILQTIDNKTYKPVVKYWLDKLMGFTGDKILQESKNEKSEKQSENWLDWDEIIRIKRSLHISLRKFINSDKISKLEYEKLLQYVLLSLYTDMPPRRNQDYLDMYVVDHWKPGMDTSRNYLDLENHKFIFNKYKTAKVYGEQVFMLSNDKRLFQTLIMLFKHHPLNTPTATEFKLLVDYEGKPLKSVNSITMILNKIFNKKIGASMLRHIYLTDKYGDNLQEMKKDSEAMAHSLGEQKNYIVNE